MQNEALSAAALAVVCWNKSAAQTSAGNSASAAFVAGDYFTGCTPIDIDVSGTEVATAAKKKMVWVINTTTATTGYRYHPLVQAFDATGEGDEERNMSAYIDRTIADASGFRTSV
jgi:hypothetical protein